ncbi:hypothetical protein E2K80_16165 [Rhodophyticola sp. CCM32]|nr:hypothetical protein E2K80_16165 [Rhodophyticola sp. CCM32]
MSSVVRNTLEARSDWVWLSKETLVKQLVKHPEIKLTDYENLEWALATTNIIRDTRPNRLHLIADLHRDKPSSLKLTIKNARNSERLFLIRAFCA